MKTLAIGTAAIMALATASVSRPDPLREVDVEQLRGARRTDTGDLGVMRPDPAVRRDWCTREKTGKRAWSDPSLSLPRQGSYYSLLSNLSYVPSTRYQGSCGDCWVWAGVGCVAIELERLTGTKDRLSVQHVNSCGTNGYGQYPCCGGWAEDLTDFFDAAGYCLPWSNSNASFADGGRTCATGSPAVGCAAVAKTPRYGITSCNSGYLTTHGVSQAAAIANIKNQLNQGKAVWFAFFMPTAADGNTFDNFWDNYTENYYLNLDYVDGHSWSDGWGHAVLCVGYDDRDAANPTWLMLNSWGTAGGDRPNGIFQIDMDMNYSATYWDGGSYYTFYWAAYDVSFTGGGDTRYVIGDGDYNGDGTDDIAVFRPSTAQWLIRGLSRFYFGQSGDVPVPGDYDGNGTTEATVFRAASGKWINRMWGTIYLGQSGDTPVPAYWTGNGGACRIGVFRPTAGKWIWSAASGLAPVYYGGSSDLPVPGDYNGDGTDDVAVFRSSTAHWLVRGRTRFYYGDSGDLPVVADFWQGGPDNPGVFRASEGKWSIRGYTKFYYGRSGDTPVPANFNGSGGDDYGIFRPSSGQWLIRFITRPYYGSSGDIPVTR